MGYHVELVLKRALKRLPGRQVTDWPVWKMAERKRSTRENRENRGLLCWSWPELRCGLPWRNSGRWTHGGQSSTLHGQPFRWAKRRLQRAQLGDSQTPSNTRFRNWNLPMQALNHHCHFSPSTWTAHWRKLEQGNWLTDWLKEWLWVLSQRLLSPSNRMNPAMPSVAIAESRWEQIPHLTREGDQFHSWYKWMNEFRKGNLHISTI